MRVFFKLFVLMRKINDLENKIFFVNISGENHIIQHAQSKTTIALEQWILKLELQCS